MTAQRNKPNIVFIMADDMGYGDPGCYGAQRIRTPHMDDIARRGIRFTDAHSSSAVCTPSRYSVLTGRYCWRSRLKDGVLGGFGAPLIEPERMTVASYLKTQGYRTAAVGKWHLGLDWTTKDGRPLSQTDKSEGWNVDGFDVDYTKPLSAGPRALGFDRFFGIAGSLDMPPYCFIEDEYPADVPVTEKTPYAPQQRRGLMSDGWRDDTVDMTFARKAAAFIDEAAAARDQKPFFLYLTPAAPHRPCLPPDFMRGASDAGLRGDMVQLVDWMAGQVLDALIKNGVLENTLLIITSDNGGRLTNFDGRDYGHRTNGELRGQKADIWDGGHREPFIAMWPERITAGGTCSELVCLGDLLATCADICGGPLPEQAAEDSFSFLPYLTGAVSGTQPAAAVRQSPAVRTELIHHSAHGMFSLREGDWKYIRGLGSGGFSEPASYPPEQDGAEGQLYNITDDISETLNHWKQEPGRIEAMEERLSRCIMEERTRPR
jgi:arylsulfatase A-like enzyme